MTFDSSRYLDWYMPRSNRHDEAVNLHSSGVRSLDPSDLPAPPTIDPWMAPRAFEEALAAWLGVTAAEVVWTPGGTGGTLLAVLVLANPGDRILVESPIYEPLFMQADRLGPVLRFSRRPADGWGLPLDEIDLLLRAGGRTRLVMITEPCNPTGTFSPRDQVLALADAAAGVGATVLINEVYRRFSDAPSYHGSRENIAIVGSLSKLLGPYWARLGWISASPPVVARLRAAHLLMSMPSSPSAAVGLSVLARADGLRAEAASTSARGRTEVDAWVRSTPGLAWVPPAGPGFGLVHLPPGLPVGDVPFAERLHDEHGALVVPGTFFDVPGAVRLSWLQAGDRLAEGLGAISSLLARISR